MLRLADSWVWDFWHVEADGEHHLYFLFASRAGGDPEGRHARAAVGHATSPDLTTWTRVQDALVHGEPGDVDDLATWTGSVVPDPDGGWLMFWTGARRWGSRISQSICLATSTDLHTWTKDPANPLLVADHPAYESEVDEAGDLRSDSFRDPWVFPDADGDGWHALITARGPGAAPEERGIVGHATSPDLRRWTLQQPLTEPGQGFFHLEVLQVVEVEGHWVLLFSCPVADTVATDPPRDPRGETWVAPAASSTGPFDIAGAYPLTLDQAYSGRLVRSAAHGGWVLLAFARSPEDPAFLSISDPRPVTWRDGRLALRDPA